MHAALVAIAEQMLRRTDKRHGSAALAHPVAQRVPVVAVLAAKLLGQAAARPAVAVRVGGQRGGHAGAGDQQGNEQNCGNGGR